MSKSLQRYTTAAGAYTFSDTGRPQYGQSSVAERDSRGGRVLRWRTRYTITQWFTEGSFGDNSARYAALRAALAVPEGVLLIQDENSTTLVSKRVQVAEHALPEQWSASLSEVKISFEAVEEITASVFDGTFTPTGLGAVSLPTVQGWSEQIDATRYSMLVPERRESRQVVACSGSIRANPEGDPAARLLALQTAAASLRGCDKKEGVLAFGIFSHTMRCDSIKADLGDGSDELKWSATFSRLVFPAGNYAEADFEVRQKDDTAANVRMTTVAGNIRAYDEAGAAAKRDAIAAVYATGRMRLDSQFNRRKVDGADGAEDAREWVFSLTYREILPGAVTSWNLNIGSKLDYPTGLITTTYSGKVTAVDSATALAKVADLAAGKHPVPLSEDKNVGSLSADGAAEQFTEVTFAYAYLTRGTALRAEVSLRNSDDPFGSVTQTVSGTAAADTEANALTLARTFIPAGLLVSKEETTGKSYHGASPDILFRTLNFSYAVQSGHSSGTLEYGVRVTEDFERYCTRTVWSGTARSASKAASDTLIDALVSGAGGTLMVNDRQPRYRDRDGDGVLPLYLQTDFTLEYMGSLSAGGNDILQADYSVDATYSVNNTVITPIPYGSPNVQTETGILPGSMVISGAVTCLTQSAGRTWARALRTFGDGGYAMQPRENSRTHYLPRSVSSVQCHTIDFSYAYAFADLVMA
jgi:hypothetical protein